MPNYREEEAFTIRLDLAAEFGEAYEGDDDGFAWLEEWKARVRPAVVRAVFDALRSDVRYDVMPVSRGASPDRELEISVRLKPRLTGAATTTTPNERS